MAEPIELTVGLWAQMGPRNHVLDGGLEVLKDVPMATIFTARRSYASAVLGVVILSVCLSVCHTRAL